MEAALLSALLDPQGADTERAMALQGAVRQLLLRLGVLPGVHVRCSMVAPDDTISRVVWLPSLSEMSRALQTQLCNPLNSPALPLPSVFRSQCNDHIGSPDSICYASEWEYPSPSNPRRGQLSLTFAGVPSDQRMVVSAFTKQLLVRALASKAMEIPRSILVTCSTRGEELTFLLKLYDKHGACLGQTWLPLLQWRETPPVGDLSLDLTRVHRDTDTVSTQGEGSNVGCIDLCVKCDSKHVRLCIHQVVSPCGKVPLCDINVEVSAFVQAAKGGWGGVAQTVLVRLDIPANWRTFKRGMHCGRFVSIRTYTRPMSWCSSAICFRAPRRLLNFPVPNWRNFGQMVRHIVK
jgi:hypothetical protein